jgi:hypothetical protein
MGLVRQSSLLVVFVGISTIALSACGGGSSQTTTARSTIGLHTCDKLIDASLGIDKAQTLTQRLESNPNDIAKAKQLLRPLTIANTLKVNESNEVAGSTVSGLFSELDGLYPGLLTKEGAEGERLDVPLVNRFLRYATTHPTLVAERRVAKEVNVLDSLLHGKKADYDLSSCGGGMTTAASLVTGAEASAHAFWPAPSEKLRALQASLR